MTKNVLSTSSVAKKRQAVKQENPTPGLIMGTQGLNEFYAEKQKQATSQLPGKLTHGSKARTGPEGNFTRIPNSAIQNSNLSHTELHLYAVLLSHEFGNGKTQMGQRLIKTETKIKRDNVKHYLKSLEKKGYIEIKKEIGQRTIYTFPKFK